LAGNKEKTVSQTGIIFDIKKYAIHDGPGIRTTVFFKGCLLECNWCHNPEGRLFKPQQLAVKRAGDNGEATTVKVETVGREVSVDEILAEVSKDIVFYDQSGGGVTFSGGEPMLQVDFLASVLDRCRHIGIHTAVDTSGYASPEDFDLISDLVDLFLYDLKFIDDDLHWEYTGMSNDLILENLARLSREGRTINIRIPLIPDVTDTEENLDSIMGFLSSLTKSHPISLLPYNCFGSDKAARFDMSDRLGTLQTQTTAALETMRRRFTSRGYTVKIGG